MLQNFKILDIPIRVFPELGVSWGPYTLDFSGVWGFGLVTLWPGFRRIPSFTSRRNDSMQRSIQETCC